jgi:hypothetical protein
MASFGGTGIVLPRQPEKRRDSGSVEQGLRQRAVPPIGFDEFDNQGIGAQHLGVQPQHVGSGLAFEADRFGVALRVEDRGLAVGIGNPELCFGLAIRSGHRLLRLKADAIDRVLRSNRLVLRLDRRLDRGPEAVGIGDPGNLEIDDLRSHKAGPDRLKAEP